MWYDNIIMLDKGELISSSPFTYKIVWHEEGGNPHE